MYFYMHVYIHAYVYIHPDAQANFPQNMYVYIERDRRTYKHLDMDIYYIYNLLL